MSPTNADEIERLLLRELARTAEYLAWSLFRQAIRPPILALVDSDGVLGRWNASHRTIELARSLPRTQSWGVVVEVLKHEMAHQYVDEVLGVRDETAHGPAFAQVCARFGIDPAASGLPANARPDDEESRLLTRISKLLALAESPNEHEARAAAALAQKLMLQHNLARERAGGGRAYEFRHLGAPTGRVPEHARILAVILEQHFFVSAIWVSVWRFEEAKRGSVLEICGTAANLELASYVHSFLLHTAERLWESRQRARRDPRNRERRAFLAGVMTGFLEQLATQRRESREQGLVWVGDPALTSYFRARHPRVSTVRYGASGPSEAHNEGREHGRRIVLTRPMQEGASGNVRALPPKRG
jgi:hypothetical protein